MANAALPQSSLTVTGTAFRAMPMQCINDKGHDLKLKTTEIN